MDIDRFFTLGPSAPFQANDIFTNREEALETFRRRAQAHSASSCDTATLMDFQRPARNIMTFVGLGGVGKSTLLSQVVRLSTEMTLPGLPARSAAALINFADPAVHSFEAVLLRVRAALGPLGRSWPAFDLALALYWERKHPDEPLVAFLRESSSGDGGPNSTAIADQVTAAVDEFAGGFGIVGLGYRLVTMAGQAATRSSRLKRLSRDLPAFQALINERDPDKMLGYLPVLLAYDLEQHRRKATTLAMCVLDTFEHVQALPPEKQGMEDLVARLVYLMPNVLFLAASRRPLQWHDPVRAVGLTYGGAHRWPGLHDTGDTSAHDQLHIDGFDDRSADRYLCERLTSDGEPAIPAQVRRRIVTGADGSPLYLELSASLFEQVASRGETPREELFGSGFPELVLRVMRDLDAEERDLLRAAALLCSFDADILAAVMPGVRQRHIEEFLKRGFVHCDPSVWPSCRLHENLRQSITTCDHLTPDGWTPAERRRNALRATHFLENVVLAGRERTPWPDDDQNGHHRRPVAGFLLALQAASEHRVLPPRLGHLAYTLYELGHWQVLSDLPALSDGAPPELVRLVTAAGLSVRSDIDARERYEQMQRLRHDPQTDPYTGFAHVTLGNLALVRGELRMAKDYFSTVSDQEPPIGSDALLGLAGCAHRASRFAEHRAYLGQLSANGLERTGSADLLGHLELHNGRFQQATEHFTTTLNAAREAAAPLWAARGTRHLALARMWTDPAGTAAMIPEARELNTALGDVVGVAQCDIAEALMYAHQGCWADARQRLDSARTGFSSAGVTFDLLPVDAVEVLIGLAEGDTEAAEGTARRILDAAAAGHPVGPPVWSALIALWTGHPDWFDFDSLDWIEADTARSRWSMPLAILRAVRASGRE